MYPGNGVQRGLRYVFSCLVGVSEMSANQQQHVYKPRGIKETAAQWGQVKSFTNVSTAAGYTQQLNVCRAYLAVLNTYLYQFHQAMKIIQK